ncbi:MAG: SemiSWEET family transporter [Candidatus Paceibacterota bacterium]
MNIIGIITVVLSLIVTGLGLSSQVRKNRNRKSMEGLSFFYFFVLAISYTFWVIYGIVLKDPVLIIPMSIGAVMSWVVVIQFFIYKTPQKMD